MATFTLVLVIAAVVFLPGLQGFAFDRQPEDDILDKWLQEQMAESQAAAHVGYATPGHVEEHDFMTAFFENQDHEAFADATINEGPGTVDDYVADFFSHGETQNSVAQETSDEAVEAYFEDVFGPAQDSNLDTETDTVSQNAPWTDQGAVGESHVPEYFNHDSVQEGTPQRAPNYAIFAKIEEDEEESYQAAETNTDRENVKNYFDNFFNTNQQESVFQNEDEDSYQPAVDDGNVNNYFENFFDTEQRESASQTQEIDGGDINNNYFDNSVDAHRQDTPSQNQPENDLEMWFQTMSESDEEVAEDEGTLLNPEFSDNFPEDDMFASVQLSIKLPPKCLAWKAEQTALQAKVTAEGKVLAAKLAILQQVLKQFRAIQKIPCNKNCRMLCIPVSAGEECVAKVNETCVLYEPKVDECGEKIEDPVCLAEEAECRGKIKDVAEKVKELKEEKDMYKEKLDKLTQDMQKHMGKFPRKCAAVL